MNSTSAFGTYSKHGTQIYKDTQRSYSCTRSQAGTICTLYGCRVEQLAREQLSTVCGVETIHRDNNIYPPFDYADVPATEKFSFRQ